MKRILCLIALLLPLTMFGAYPSFTDLTNVYKSLAYSNGLLNGVTTINGLTNSVVITNGPNTAMAVSGNTITISANGTNYTFSGQFLLMSGTNVSLAASSIDPTNLSSSSISAISSIALGQAKSLNSAPVEQLSDPLVRALWSDDFNVTNSVAYTNNQKILSSNPDGGPYWTVLSDTVSGTAYMTNGELCMFCPSNGTLRTCVILTNLTALNGQTAAGYTLVADARLDTKGHNGRARLWFGWTTNYQPVTIPSNYSRAYPIYGVLYDAEYSGPTHHGVGALDDSAFYSLFGNSVKAGQKMRLFAQLTTNGFRAMIQGGFASQFNNYIGSPDTFPVYTGTSGALTTNIIPIITLSYGTEDARAYISRVRVYPNILPGNTTALLASGLADGTYSHTAGLCVDASNHLWACWQQGNSDTATNCAVYVAYRKVDGTWSPAAMVVAPAAQPAAVGLRYNGGSISTNLSGQVILIYDKTTDGWTNNFGLFYKVMAYDGTNVSAGAETPINITNIPAGSYTESYSPMIKAPDGSLLLPVMVGTSNNISTQATNFVARSVDNMAHWALSTNGITTNTIPWWEGQLVIEQDGTLAQYIREDSYPYPPSVYMRSISTNNGISWTFPTPTTIPSMARASVSSLPDGRTLLVANDNLQMLNSDGGGNPQRAPVSAWILGSGGIVQQRIEIFDYNGDGDNFNYPAGVYYNGKICTILTPKNERQTWFTEIPLNGEVRNMVLERERNDRLNNLYR
jgi:hypothetical protein